MGPDQLAGTGTTRTAPTPEYVSQVRNDPGGTPACPDHRCGTHQAIAVELALDGWAELGDTSVVLIVDGHSSDVADLSDQEGRDGDERTRDRVRQALAADGPLTAAALASGLNLTPGAVRRHLDRLAEENAIAEYTPATTDKRGRGRPARAYVLAEAGHAGMDDHYADVASSALHFLADQMGAAAVDEFARRRGAELEARYAAQVAAAGANIIARAEALAAALSTDGFAASIRPVPAGMPVSGIQLCQGHCPIQHVATAFPVFCDAEADAFSRLLGGPVQRQTTLAHGEHACTTFIPPSFVPVKQPSEPTATDDGVSDDARSPWCGGLMERAQETASEHAT